MKKVVVAVSLVLAGVIFAQAPLSAFTFLSKKQYHSPQNKVYVASDTFRTCPSSLKPAVDTIMKLSEARAFVNGVQKEGLVGIEEIKNSEFEALWYGNSRTVKVDTSERRSLASLIRSILFELHNASSDRQLFLLTCKAQRGVISKEEYVRGVEQMEYQNVRNTARLIQIGINNGVFPKETFYAHYPDFADHYLLQQLSGHSQWIAANYDQMNPDRAHISYIGSVPFMTDGVKKDAWRYLSVKSEYLFAQPKQKLALREQVVAEYTRLKDQLCMDGHPSRSTAAKKQLIEFVFADTFPEVHTT